MVSLGKMKDSMVDKKQHVVVLGASPTPDRHSNRAVRLLLQQVDSVVAVHPTVSPIEGLPALPNPLISKG